MSIQAVDSNQLDSLISDLASVSTASVSIGRRIELCRECIEGVFAERHEWAVQAIRAKGLADDSPLKAEDLLSGPCVVLRQLQLTIQTLSAIATSEKLHLPGSVKRLANGLSNGQLAIPVFPTTGYFDSMTFMGLNGVVRMQPGVEEADIHGNLIEEARSGNLTGIVGVLGAGNVSSIPATDSLTKIMFEGKRVVLKMNPVNDYLAPIFERAFGPLIRENLLRIVTGGVDVGASLTRNPKIDEIHITGSAETHDRIVWGTDIEEQQRRQRDNDPVLAKTITSELGNVTPWIIAPGKYSARELQSQAKHVAASITNNVSFNCLATKAVITWDQWPQREKFVALINKALEQTPTRPAYYPGAEQRYAQFRGEDVQPDDSGALPWCLLEDQSFDERPELFRQESFVCICAETALSAASPETFLAAATDFANDQMTGTLCASVTFPKGFRRRHAQAADKCLNELRYGSVCVNQWSGLAYGFTSPPWGAYPGATLADVQSGIGSVHNTYLLDRFEKTVLEGPLVNFPKPVWFPDHTNAVNLADRLARLYHQPSIFRLPPLFAAALMG